MSPRNTVPGSDYTRREFGMLALAGLPLSLIHASAGTLVGGVRIGVQSYSLRSMPQDEAIKAMAAIGIEECELFSGHVEPRSAFGPSGPAAGRPPEPPVPPTPPAPPAPPTPSSGSTPRGTAPPAPPPPSPPTPPQRGGPGPNPAARDALRQWRLTTPLEHFAAVRKKFDAAGVKLQAYNLSFNDSFTDEEIDRGFQMAKALGVNVITASSTLSAAKRVAPFADKHAITVAMHNHSNVKDPNEFATPESFAQALTFSKHFAVNLDIGHFVAAGFDPVAYIDANHARITNLHLKDRKKDQGANVPWGEGDTPIKEVLQLLRQKKYDIPANIEYEYRGEDAVAEVRKCFEFCKTALT
jgi:sugar phosphate isomerase/epimerase